MFVLVIITFFIIIIFALPQIVTITATQTTSAKILKIDYCYHGKFGHRWPQRRAVYEYYVDGKKYIKTSFYPTNITDSEIGQEVEIYYREKNPNDSFLARDKQKRLLFGNLSLIVFFILFLATVYMFYKEITF